MSPPLLPAIGANAECMPSGERRESARSATWNQDRQQDRVITETAPSLDPASTEEATLQVAASPLLADGNTSERTDRDDSLRQLGSADLHTTSTSTSASAPAQPLVTMWDTGNSAANGEISEDSEIGSSYTTQDQGHATCQTNTELGLSAPAPAPPPASESEDDDNDALLPPPFATRHTTCPRAHEHTLEIVSQPQHCTTSGHTIANPPLIARLVTHRGDTGELTLA